MERRMAVAGAVAAVAFTIVGVLAIGGAVAQPAGVFERAGAWVAPDGKPLYTFAKDMPGASACIGRCADAWPPLLAPPNTPANDDWSTITRPDGSLQWAYKGRPVYTYARDVAGEPASGVSAMWPLAIK
jgi:predicted lipoprotein with Yx(FWY)xxD motif